ncbi:TM1802 family CRISPR-associated protein [Desulfobacula phenolica]|uniref:CRISPR-associated protein Csh1 n=1 Tax=Desulfobacula phenolica TaxID=90732 RepID=A0A1H2HZ02_9BACT|nr:TM1802 family CRISPR-associated protein [Desulfobacula phenolica]SDU36788.1 CRISPR-associated protein Csh1 [Desulfobacula phenolica]
MSLSYKLWKIGSILSEKDIKEVIKINPDANSNGGEEQEYINLNFNIKESKVISLELNKNSISKDKMFFTKKMGGAGGGIYYLYPNLQLKLKEKESIKTKLPLLINTMKKSVLCFSQNRNQELSQAVVDFFDNNTTDDVIASLDKIIGGYFWFWISINGRTLPESMPEIWTSWFEKPVNKLKESGPGYDIFTNQETLVGYRPEFKIFSYDQYHDSLNYRVKENLPLSLESAGNIKLAWIYILEKLIFFYKGLEYIIIPNMISDDPKAYQKILDRLVRANNATKRKPGKLDALWKEEKKLKSALDRLKKKLGRKKTAETKQVGEIAGMNKEYKETIAQITTMDTGLITEFNEQADQLADLKNSVTLDFIFTTINRTNLSFEVKGAIEDVVPSRLAKLVDVMKSFGIEDNITLHSKNRDKIYLQDYFNRDELYFVINKSQKQNKNRILQERLHLARLLLTDEKITTEDLLTRFEFHRESDYAHKKRINNGIRDWINFPENYTRQENKVMKFFHAIKKIKE